MIADRYTKAVLTVIAVCLVWMSLGGPSLLPTVSAQVSPMSLQRVLIAGWVERNGNIRLFPDSDREPALGASLPVVQR